MSEEEDLIDKLFNIIAERIEEREASRKLSKCARIRHQGQVLEVYLIPQLPLSDDTATITIVDVDTKVEVCTVDLNDTTLRYLDLPYVKACVIFDKIVESWEGIETDLKNGKTVEKTKH